ARVLLRLCPTCLPAVIGALYQLPRPGAVRRGIKPLCVSGRSFQMEYLRAGKMGASNLPLFAHCIGSQNECTLARTNQYSYTAHLSPMRRASASVLRK